MSAFSDALWAGLQDVRDEGLKTLATALHEHLAPLEEIPDFCAGGVDGVGRYSFSLLDKTPMPLAVEGVQYRASVQLNCSTGRAWSGMTIDWVEPIPVVRVPSECKRRLNQLEVRRETMRPWEAAEWIRRLPKGHILTEEVAWHQPHWRRFDMSAPKGIRMIFAAPMVRAILAGQKTQTRRLRDTHEPIPQVGDTLVVCETWSWAYADGTGEHVVYKADVEQDPDFFWGAGWRPAASMHPNDARLRLRVTAVREERLQEISWEDAKAEGVQSAQVGSTVWYGIESYGETSPVRAFQRLWDELHEGRGTGGNWDSNPMVRVITFEVEEMKR